MNNFNKLLIQLNESATLEDVIVLLNNCFLETVDGEVAERLKQRKGITLSIADVPTVELDNKK